MERKTVTISLPLPILEIGRSQAKARYKTFSGYLADLIERDSESFTTEVKQKKPRIRPPPR
jgi:hypothetical protein